MLAALLIGFLASHSLKRRGSPGLENLQFAPVTSGRGVGARFQPGRRMERGSPTRARQTGCSLFTAIAGGPAAQITHSNAHAMFPLVIRRAAFVLHFCHRSAAYAVAGGARREQGGGGGGECGAGCRIAGRTGAGAAAKGWRRLFALAVGPPGKKAERYTRLKPVARWSWLAFSPDGKKLGVWGSAPDGRRNCGWSPWTEGTRSLPLKAEHRHGPAILLDARRLNRGERGRSPAVDEPLRGREADGDSRNRDGDVPGCVTGRKRIAFASVRFGYE